MALFVAYGFVELVVSEGSRPGQTAMVINLLFSSYDGGLWLVACRRDVVVIVRHTGYELT